MDYFSDQNDLYLKIQIVVEKFVLGLVEVTPLFVIPLFFLAIAWSYSLWKGKIDITPAEVFFFCCAGVAGAFLNHLSKGGVLENALPSFVVAMTFMFQLVGLSRGQGKVPLRTTRVFLAGTGLAISFIVASRYITLLLGDELR